MPPRLNVSQPEPTARRFALPPVRLAVACLAVYWVLFVTAFHIPLGPQPVSTSAIPPDKRAHLLGYGLLAVLVSWVAWPYGSQPESRRLPSLVLRGGIVFALVTLHGWIDELTQPWTGRAYDLKDLAADAVGAALGVVAFSLLTMNRRLRVWAAR